MTRPNSFVLNQAVIRKMYSSKDKIVIHPNFLKKCRKLLKNSKLIKYRFISDEWGFAPRSNKSLLMRKVWSSIFWPVKSDTQHQRLATAATFLRSCVAQVLSHGDEIRTRFDVIARVYCNEDWISVKANF